ncbi:MAG TPA: hypothetical protein VFM74_01360, partial [Candidatus Limnocylindria bacterium]|nr:hypothetical protein [Candidatus Limnocylindria bacterium]
MNGSSIALRRRTLTLAGLVALASAFFVAWVLLRPGTHDQFVTGDNLAQLLGNLLGLALCYLPLHGRPWRRSAHAQSGIAPVVSPRGARRWAPVLLSLAILSETIGQAIYTYIQDIQHQAIMFPSWADAVYLCVYPFALLGILLLAHRPLSLAARMRVFFDGLMLMTGALTFSWYFILGPTVLQSGQTPFEAAVGGAYPVGDLLLMVCLLLLAARASDGHLRQAVGLLALALGVIVVTDSVYDFQLLHGGYSTGSILDVGWCLGYSLLGLGTLAYRRA